MLSLYLLLQVYHFIFFKAVLSHSDSTYKFVIFIAGVEIGYFCREGEMRDILHCFLYTIYGVYMSQMACHMVQTGLWS